MMNLDRFPLLAHQLCQDWARSLLGVELALPKSLSTTHTSLPSCFLQGETGSEPRQRALGAREYRAGLNPGVPGVGMGPILRIGQNDKVPATYRPPYWLNTDATFRIVKRHCGTAPACRIEACVAEHTAHAGNRIGQLRNETCGLDVSG